MNIFSIIDHTLRRRKGRGKENNKPPKEPPPRGGVMSRETAQMVSYYSVLAFFINVKTLHDQQIVVGPGKYCKVV